MPWRGDEFSLKDVTSSSICPSVSLVQWMSRQQSNHMPASQSGLLPNALLGNFGTDDHSKLLNFQSPTFPAPALHFNQVNQLNQQDSQIQQPSFVWPRQQ